MAAQGTSEPVGDSGDEPVENPREEPAHGLEPVVDAFNHLASVLPAGHELFTAVLDAQHQAGDVLVRDPSGVTSVRLGLADSERRQLAMVIASLRDQAAEARAPQVAGELLGVDDGHLHERDYRSIVEESPVPLLVICADGMIEYASPAVVPTLGVDEPSGLEGLFVAQLLHRADRDRVARVAELSLRRLDTTTLTVRMRRWDGSLVRVEIAVRVLPGRDRLILALQEAGTDRNGIDEVLASERRQRALAGAADAGVALVSAAGDSAGAVIDLNPQFGRLTGGAPGQLVGTSLWELVHPTDSARVHQALREVVDGGGPRRLEVHLTGEPAHRASLAIGLDRSSGDPPALATVLLRDISDQRLPELNRTVARLEKQNQELAEFARVTAHDLVAPLRALSGLVDVLAPQLEEQSEDALVAMQSAIGRMLAMVDGALGYTDARSRKPSHTPVALGDVVDRVLAMLGPDIVAEDAEVALGELPTVSGDEAQIERLFICLLSNALAYSGGDRPQIQIGATPEATGWRITVADEGIGVPAEARESIFDLFERGSELPAVNGSASRTGTGHGIGLATARQIVNHHGGRIWVEANRPFGSVFSFTLPGP